MQDQKITSRQIILVGVTYVLNFALIRVPGQLATAAKQHAYLPYLIAAAVVALMLILLIRCARRFPGKDLFQSLTERHPLVGRCIGLLYVLFFFIILTRDIRIISDFTNIVLLPLTPIIVTGILIVATVIYIGRGGLNSIVSITELYLPFLIFLILMTPIIQFKDFDFKLMKPLFYVDWKGVGEGSWLVVSYLGQIIALPFIISSGFNKLKYSLYSLLLSTGLLVMLMLMMLMVLGVPITGRLTYPAYELVRQLRITDFLDRFDLFLVAAWFPVIFLNIAISLYIVCYGLKTMFPAISGKMMSAPVGLLAFSCSFWFYENAIQVFEFNREWTVIALLFICVFPILLFFIHRPSRRSNPQGTSES